MYHTAYRAFIDSTRHAPRLVNWGKATTGRTRATVAFDSLAHAQAFVGGDAFTSDSARKTWEDYRNRRCKREPGFCGGVTTPAKWDAVVRDPGDGLRRRVEQCMARLDSIPVGFGERPRRRTVRGLDEGDELDAVRMVEDHNLDRAWSERRMRSAVRPVLRIAMNAELSSSQGPDAIAWRGAVAMAIARRAEAAGADVELTWITIGCDTVAIGGPDNVELLVTVPVKRLGEFADRDSLVAYFCHLASFRYFGFHLIAALNPGPQMLGSYGRPMSLRECGADYHILIDMHDVNDEQQAQRMMERAASIVNAQMEKHGI